jgi:hypothetical protein
MRMSRRGEIEPSSAVKTTEPFAEERASRRRKIINKIMNVIVVVDAGRPGIVPSSSYKPLAIITASPVASVRVLETVRDADVVSLRPVRSQSRRR